ncbi:MAG: LysR family transcriptional regulator [Bacillota bacterium]|nr:LysR family transcriptional regulator [Bacillota bacterium]
MELHQLRYVCAIAEMGSFSRAAEHCHVAQPSLSQQVSKLEEELGTRLFDRLGRRVRLTDAGRAFLARARAILQEVEAARFEVDDARKNTKGSITVGVIPTVAPYFMPARVAAFTHKYPEATLKIVEETTPVLVDRVRDLSLDMAILALPLRHREFVITPLLREPLFAVLPRDHPLACQSQVSLRDLRTEPFVLLRDSHCFHGVALAACQRARINPHVVFESGQFSSLLGMVSAGVGVSIVPAMAVDAAEDRVFVRIADQKAQRTIAAVVLRGRSLNRVQGAFLEHLLQSDQNTKRMASCILRGG